MNRYRVYGTERELGAIGWPQEFWLDVEAPDAIKAEEIARAARYESKHEHVHIRRVSLLAPPRETSK